MQQVERVDDDGKLCLTRKYFTGNNTLSLVYEITEHRQRLVVDVTKGYRKKDGVLWPLDGASVFWHAARGVRASFWNCRIIRCGKHSGNFIDTTFKYSS